VLSGCVHAATERRLALMPTDRLVALPLLQPQVSGVGRIAVAAAEDIVTRLKSRLVNIGAAPDYGAIVNEIRSPA